MPTIDVMLTMVVVVANNSTYRSGCEHTFFCFFVKVLNVFVSIDSWAGPSFLSAKHPLPTKHKVVSVFKGNYSLSNSCMNLELVPSASYTRAFLNAPSGVGALT